MWTNRNILSLLCLLFFGVFILHDIVPHKHEIISKNEHHHTEITHANSDHHHHAHSHQHSHKKENDQEQKGFLDFLFGFHAHSFQTRSYDIASDLKVVSEISQKVAKYAHPTNKLSSVKNHTNNKSLIPYNIVSKSFFVTSFPSLRAPPSIG